MGRPSRRLASAYGMLAVLVAAGAGAQNPPVYRYVDPAGNIGYSDQPPPPNSTGVEAKRLTPNLIETDPTPLAVQRAQERFPVTLYTFPCGDICDRAEALLTKRGIPYTTVNVQDAKGTEKLKKVTGGDLQAPVLQAGDRLIVKGFGESQWQALLDSAGYPKTPVGRRPPPVPEAPKPPPAPPPPFSESAAGGYPKD